MQYPNITILIFLEFSHNFVLNINIRISENIHPIKHHNIKDSATEDIKIIFFKTTASHPVNNKAQNLKTMSFLNNILKNPPSCTVSKNKPASKYN